MPRFPIAERQLLVRVLTVSALALLPILFFYPAIFGDVALVPGDGWTQNFGVRVLIGRMIARGEWPLWNPYIFAGTPLLASIYPVLCILRTGYSLCSRPPPRWTCWLSRPITSRSLARIYTHERLAQPGWSPDCRNSIHIWRLHGFACGPHIANCSGCLATMDTVSD